MLSWPKPTSSTASVTRSLPYPSTVWKSHSIHWIHLVSHHQFPEISNGRNQQIGRLGLQSSSWKPTSACGEPTSDHVPGSSPFTMAFPHLFLGKKKNQGGDPRYFQTPKTASVSARIRRSKAMRRAAGWWFRRFYICTYIGKNMEDMLYVSIYWEE